MMTIKEGFRREISGVKIEALHPPSSYKGKMNNSSLVLRLRFGSHTLLFTGDIEREAEIRLLRGHPSLSTDILKVPHHGSLTSSTYSFVQGTSPLFAVISVGKNNPFHLPAPRVLSRYRAVGSTILRTDRDGAITFLSDGEKLRLYTFSERPSKGYRLPLIRR